MNCNETRELLSLYIDEVLSAGEKAALEKHLASCEACRLVLEQTRCALASLKTLQEKPLPPGFMAELNERLERETVKSAPFSIGLLRHSWMRGTVAALTLVLVVVLIKEIPWREQLPRQEQQVLNLQKDKAAAPAAPVMARSAAPSGEKEISVSREKNTRTLHVETPAAMSALPESSVAIAETAPKKEARAGVAMDLAEESALAPQMEAKAAARVDNSKPFFFQSTAFARQNVQTGGIRGGETMKPLNDSSLNADRIERESFDRAPDTVARKADRTRSKNDTIFAGQWKGFNSGCTVAGRKIITDPAAWESFWKEFSAPSPTSAPEIDFARYMVLAVLMGEKGSGGYAIEITRINQEGKQMVAYYKETRPERDAMTAMALTQPYHIVIIDRYELPVIFKKQ